MDQILAQQLRPDPGPRNVSRELLESDNLRLSKAARKTLKHLAQKRDEQIERDAIAQAEREAIENDPTVRLQRISAANLVRMAEAAGPEFVARAGEIKQLADDGRCAAKGQALDSALQSDLLDFYERQRNESALGRMQATKKLLADEAKLNEVEKLSEGHEDGTA